MGAWWQSKLSGLWSRVRPGWRPFVVPIWSLLGVLLAWQVAAAVNTGLGLVAVSELTIRADIRAAVRQLLDQADFTALERMATDYRDQRLATPSGVRKLSVFYGAIHETAAAIDRDDKAAWRQLETQLRHWRQRFPKSPTPVVATGVVMKRQAWAHRPRLTVVEISTASDELFVARLRLARVYLQGSAAIGSSDPEFHVVLAQTAMAESEDMDQFFMLIERGLVVDPGYHKLAFTGLDYFVPAAGGSPKDVQRLQAFANSMVKRAAADPGLYARLYWHATAAGYAAKAGFDWPRVIASMDAVIAQNPDDWNIDNLARLACQASDKATARRLIAQRKGPPFAAVWPAKALHDMCAA